MSEYKDMRLEISKILGDVVDVNLPVPIALQEVCNLDTAEPGEDVYKMASLETSADEIKTIDADGIITASKYTLKSKTALSFTSLNTDKVYILVDEILDSPDQKAFERNRAKLIRGLDKIEVRLLLKLVSDDSDVAEISIGSGEDLYDVIVKAKHALEDYGDNFKMLAGSAVKEGIDNYNKRKADNLNYNVDLPGTLKRIGIDVRKIFGYVKYTGDGSKQRLLDTNKFQLVAVNSTITEGKPLWFVRKRINPEIAKMMNADVDNAQRAVFVDPAPTQVEDSERLGFGVYAYESIILANTNYKSIVKSADLSSILGTNL